MATLPLRAALAPDAWRPGFLLPQGPSPEPRAVNLRATSRYVLGRLPGFGPDRLARRVQGDPCRERAALHGPAECVQGASRLRAVSAGLLSRGSQLGGRTPPVRVQLRPVRR